MDQQCIGLLQNNGRMWWENPTQWQDCQELRLKELWVKLMKNSKQASCMGLSSFLGFILSHILWNKLLTLSTDSIGEACVWCCWGGRSFPWIRSACQVEQMREEIFKGKEAEAILYDDETVEEEDFPTYSQDSQEYMHWHYRLNHPTHTVMIKMAK